MIWRVARPLSIQFDEAEQCRALTIEMLENIAWTLGYFDHYLFNETVFVMIVSQQNVENNWYPDYICEEFYSDSSPRPIHTILIVVVS